MGSTNFGSWLVSHDNLSLKLTLKSFQGFVPDAEQDSDCR